MHPKRPFPLTTRRIEPLEARIALATFLVTTTADSGPGSLRQALIDSNLAPAEDIITFEMPAGTQVIKPLSPFPAILSPVNIVGDIAVTPNSTPRFVLSGELLPAGSDGLFFGFGSGGSSVTGLTISRFSGDGIEFSASDHSTVTRCLIGGSSEINFGNGTGIRLTNSNGVTIGGDSSPQNLTKTNTTLWGDSNVIIGNSRAGISVSGGADNGIYANLIGINASSSVSKNGTGVEVLGGSVEIGRAGAGNVISGNKLAGILIENADLVGIKGNLIGTNISGTSARANEGDGIVAQTAFQGLTIGGAAAGEGNLISGNLKNGVSISGNPSGMNTAPAVFKGNLIGTNVDGAQAIGNQLAGIRVQNWQNVQIGTGEAGSRNVLSGNSASAIVLMNARFAKVQGNYIGTDASGTKAVGNAFYGVEIVLGDTVTIGGTSPEMRNVISGNQSAGISLAESSSKYAGASKVSIIGNYIGTDPTGTIAVGNKFSGVFCGGTEHTIAFNLISGNSGPGISLSGSLHNVDQNRIGTNAAGTAALGNGSAGIDFGPAQYPYTTSAIEVQRNVISGNGTLQSRPGIDLYGQEIRVSQNFIGLDVSGTFAIPNSGSGITGSAFGTIEDNAISGNGKWGVDLPSGAMLIVSNMVGTAASGDIALPNASGGVRVSGGSISTNVISGNHGPGIEVFGGGMVNLTRNFIGTDAAGTHALGNFGAGVLIVGTGTVSVGSDSVDNANTIAGNASAGIESLAGGTLFLLNNRIGVGLGGEKLGNGDDGVRVSGSNLKLTARFNTIGANKGHGISVMLGTKAREVIIESNLVGFADVEQSYVADGNGLDGVHIEGAGAINTSLLSVSHNKIAANGGAAIAVKNLDFDNSDPALARITQAAAVIADNTIGGVNDFSNPAMQKPGIGILVDNCTFIRIGLAGSGNTIAGQAGTNNYENAAIRVVGGKSIQIGGNFIGTHDVGQLDSTGHILSINSEDLLIGFDDGRGAQPSRGGVNLLVGSGIYTSGGRQDVMRNEILDSSLGIMTLAGDHHRFIDNLILNSRKWGIGFDGGWDYPVISGNTITGAPYGGIYLAGTGAIISDNHIENVGGTGISAWGDSVSVIRNKIENTEGAAVELGYATSVTVIDNQLSGFTGAGIRFSRGRPMGIVADNSISDGKGVGVEILGGNVEVRRNSIFGITGQPIDLGGDGLNINDSLDLDAGPNSLQNTVVLRSVVERNGQLIIRGTFDGARNRTLQVEFFGITVGEDGSEIAGRMLAGSTIVTDNDGHAVIAITIDSPFTANKFFATVTDEIDHVTSEAAFGNVYTAAEVFAAGSGNGAKGTAALVRVGTPTESVLSVIPYGPGFRGGVHVAHADINGDGVDDLVTSPARGAQPVKVFSGLDGTLLASWSAAPRSFRGGVSIATGDVDGDGTIEIVTALGSGTKPIVLVHDALTGAVEGQFSAFAGARRSGLNLSTGDLDADGDDDIVASWASGPALARAFTGDGSPISPLLRPFAKSVSIGAFTAVIPATEETGARIAIGSGHGARAAVQLFDLSGTLVESVPLFNRAPVAGLRLGVADIDGDGIANIVAARGAGLPIVESLTSNGQWIRNTLPASGRFGVYLG